MHPKRLIAIIYLLVLLLGVPSGIYGSFKLIRKNQCRKTLRLNIPETIIMKYQCKAVKNPFKDFEDYIPKMMKEAGKRWFSFRLPSEFSDEEIEKAKKSLPSKEECKCLNLSILRR
jgi:hypothetical protein